MTTQQALQIAFDALTKNDALSLSALADGLEEAGMAEQATAIRSGSHPVPVYLKYNVVREDGTSYTVHLEMKRLVRMVIGQAESNRKPQASWCYGAIEARRNPAV